MLGVRAALAPVRFHWAALFAVTLAMRLLTPSGFMPAFDQGRLMIVDCPGSGAAPMLPMRGMGHDPGKTCQLCPHAIATGAGLTDPVPVGIGAPIFAAFVPVIWRLLTFEVANIKHSRPPAIGPPLSARFISRPN